LEAALPDFIASFQKQNRDDGHYSLFEGEAEAEPEVPEMPDVPDCELFQRLEHEKEVVGIYISGHPFDACEESMRRYATCAIEDLPCWKSPTAARVGGIILSVTDKLTKSGKSIGLMNFEDSDNGIEIVSFSKNWETLKGRIQIGEPYVAEGRLGDREPKSFILEKLTPLKELEKSNPGWVRIRLRTDLISEKPDFKRFAVALKDCPGRSPVLLELLNERDLCVLSLSNFSVGSADTVQTRLSDFIAPGACEIYG
jgi:DNA polymerase-3 subunit alpha